SLNQIGMSGTNGSALGQFNRATHLSANKRGLYVADTGNNRVQVFTHVEGGEMHSPTPFKMARLKAGDINGALSLFSFTSKDKYREGLLALSKEERTSMVKDMEKLKPITIEGDHAQYRFDSVIQGTTITFPVEFNREFGLWKIVEY